MVQTVRVGVGVFVLRSKTEDPANPYFLVGKRRGAHGGGTYGLPGGHLEFGETLEDCATRETQEETGLKIRDLTFLTATNDIMSADNKHYVTLFMVCVRKDDETVPQVLEPDKCDGWKWVSWSEIIAIANNTQQPTETREQSPQLSLFTPLLSLIQQRPGLIPSVRGISVRGISGG